MCKCVCIYKREREGFSLFRGFTPEPGADIINPGLVADGTRCGNDLVIQTHTHIFCSHILGKVIECCIYK